VTSFFDRQTNCLPSPERELVWTFLTIYLDPLVPGILVDVYNLAWAGLGEYGEYREAAFRSSFHLTNVHIIDVEFVVQGVGPWFAAWAASIEAGESAPFDPCVCDTF
jgi:hypothetical protein